MRKNNRAARTLVKFFVGRSLLNNDVDEISKFQVLATRWKKNSKSFILYIQFNDTQTSPFVE